MPATNLSPAQREENTAFAAADAAETALCAFARLNGVTYTDEQFETQKWALANAIYVHLLGVEAQAALAELRRRDAV